MRKHLLVTSKEPIRSHNFEGCKPFKANKASSGGVDDRESKKKTELLSGSTNKSIYRNNSVYGINDSVMFEI